MKRIMSIPPTFRFDAAPLTGAAARALSSLGFLRLLLP
jgi:hypothetical protein